MRYTQRVQDPAVDPGADPSIWIGLFATRYVPVPGYHPEGMYEFKVDLNHDAIEELTYRVTFNDRAPRANRISSCAASLALTRPIRVRRALW